MSVLLLRGLQFWQMHSAPGVALQLPYKLSRENKAAPSPLLPVTRLPVLQCETGTVKVANAPGFAWSPQESASISRRLLEAILEASLGPRWRNDITSCWEENRQEPLQSELATRGIIPAN